MRRAIVRLSGPARLGALSAQAACARHPPITSGSPALFRGMRGEAIAAIGFIVSRFDSTRRRD